MLYEWSCYFWVNVVSTLCYKKCLKYFASVLNFVFALAYPQVTACLSARHKAVLPESHWQFLLTCVSITYKYTTKRSDMNINRNQRLQDVQLEMEIKRRRLKRKTI